jgi:hypothetical protein
MRRSSRLNSWSFAAVALVMVAAGCSRDDVKVYKVDSSDTATAAPPPAAMSPSPMPGTMPPGLAMPDKSGLPGLKYNLPDGWKEKELTQMRMASFDISENGKSVDVSVIPLGPMSGTDAANVTRWLGQVGQPPIDDDGAKKIAEAVQIGSQPANLYDLNGGDQRIVGAILHGTDATWYFKMMGDSALAEKNKPAFVAFLKSVEFQKSAAPAPMDLSQLPPSHLAIPETTTQVAATPMDKPVWMVPSNWKEGELMQFLVARYVIQGNGDTTATVNVSELDGDGGGLLANVNRWRGQLGQPPVADDDVSKLPTLDASSAKATIADFTGTDMRSGKPARMIGLVLPLNGHTWFYKLTGDPDLVAAQKDTFIAFVQSAKYPAQ